MYRFLLRLLVIALSMGGILNAAWEERQIHGRGYVSAESIKSFYAFDSLARDGIAKVATRPCSNAKAHVSAGTPNQSVHYLV